MKDHGIHHNAQIRDSCSYCSVYTIPLHNVQKVWLTILF